MKMIKKNHHLHVTGGFFSSAFKLLVLAKTPGVFQELLFEVLERQKEFVLAYLDDILAFLDAVENHLKLIQKLRGSLRKHYLELMPAKCE